MIEPEVLVEHPGRARRRLFSYVKSHVPSVLSAVRTVPVHNTIQYTSQLRAETLYPVTAVRTVPVQNTILFTSQLRAQTLYPVTAVRTVPVHNTI